MMTRKSNYDLKKKELFRKAFREQLYNSMARSESDMEIQIESNGELKPPDFVNDLLRSNSSLDSRGISRLRRKEIMNQKLDADLRQFEYRKKRTIFGRRPTQRLFKRDEFHHEKPKPKQEEKEREDSEEEDNSEYDDESDEGQDGEKGSWQDKIIISTDSAWKSYFDVWILMLVGYSCFTTLFYVAFQQPTNRYHLAWD
jgi:hypothetical protein